MKRHVHLRINAQTKHYETKKKKKLQNLLLNLFCVTPYSAGA